MSFKRHWEIYPSDEDAGRTGAPAHRLDEFPVGYSLAGCAPAVPASASPTVSEVCAEVVFPVDYFSSNGQHCLNCLSHARGQVQSVAEGDLPTSVAEAFAKHIEAILKAWHFPEADRVFFDPKSRDLVISGKARGARGKGLRAITHAAFTVGLLDYCKTKETPHPGFVIMDSPLLAYRKPEGSEDDLTETDLEEKFYDFLGALPEDRQVIIVENRDPPEVIRSRPQSVMFSKNPHSGRYGLFPMEAEQTAKERADNPPKNEQ